MKLIELFNDYAIGKVCERIRFKGFIYKINHGDYYSEFLDKYLLADGIVDLTNLNDEVEILSERMIIEELTYENTFKNNSDMEVQEVLVNKINELIKEIKKIRCENAENNK